MTRFVHERMPYRNPMQCLHEKVTKTCDDCKRDFVTVSRTAIRCDECRKARKERKK